VKDKYGKTINYMEAVFATNCCIGFDSKPKTYVCHDKLFVRNLVEGIVKSFFLVYHQIYGILLQKKMMMMW